MEFKIPIKQAVLKVLLVSFITVIAFYLLSALFIANNRINYKLENTTWISREDGIVKFYKDNSGEYKKNEDEIIPFTYENSRGYIICYEEDVVIYEFIGLRDSRIFSVNMNVMFYDLESLGN